MPTPTFPSQFNIADYFLHDRLGEGLGEKCAIRFGQHQYSYADVAERSQALARYFVDLGLVQGERVYTVLLDVPPFAWSIFATLSAGGVVAMGNPQAPAEALGHVVDYSSASVVICTLSAARKMAPALARSHRLRAVLLVDELNTGDDCDDPGHIETLHAHHAHDQGGSLAKLDDSVEILALSTAIEKGRKSDSALPQTHRDDICVWLFTSGSTGRPKAAVHTHRDFAFNTEVYAKQTLGYTADDVTVSVPCLFFGYATGTNLWFPFSVGATVALFSERPTAESLSQAIARDQPTIVTNVPTMLGKLLDYDESLRANGGSGIDMSSVRFHLSAGEALPPSLLTRFLERFGGQVYDGIGSAEMFHIYASNRPGDVRPGSLGRAVDGYQLRVLAKDAEGPGATELATGEVGVLWVRGDSVALGYHQDRDKSWATFHGHWCRTGDLFRKDADGYLWFAGRADDLFKVGGIFVAPQEVEECLMAHLAVSAACVIPANHAGLIKPKAFVVIRPEHQAADDESLHSELSLELKTHCQNALSKHKYPRTIVFLDELPKNDRGKIDRKRLIAAEAYENNA